MNLDEALSIGYRSCAVAVAAGKTRQRILQRAAFRADREMKRLENEEEKTQANKRLALWNTLFTAQNYMVSAFTYNSDELKGFKLLVEELWLHIGNDVANLPNWNRTQKLKGVVSFANFRSLKMPEIRDMEKSFTGNRHEIPDDSFDTQFEALFDLLVNDLWKVLGMSRWCDKRLDKTGLDAETLAKWDHIITNARIMIRDAAKCHHKIGNMLQCYQLDTPDEAKFEDKYKQKASKRYKCVQGLFALDPAILPANYSSRMEENLVGYR